MNLAVAQNAVLLERNKPEIAAVVADIPVNNVRCSQLFVLLVEKKQLYLSNHLVTNQCIAVTATSLVHATIGKLLIVKTFPSFKCVGRFFSFI